MNLHELRKVFQSSEKTYHKSKSLFLKTIRKYIRKTQDYNSDFLLDYFYLSGSFDDYDIFYTKSENFKLVWFDKNKNSNITYSIKNKVADILEELTGKNITFDDFQENYCHFYIEK